jgi:hypothetical protein
MADEYRAERTIEEEIKDAKICLYSLWLPL